MSRNLNSLGYARVFRHPRTGELLVDTDSLRRGAVSGFGDEPDDDDDFEGDDELGDDLEGDDDVGDDFGDDLEGDDELGDDLEGDELGDDDVGDDFGISARRKKRLCRRLARMQRREARIERKLGKGRKRRKAVKWGMTIVSGSDTLSAAGAASVQIRLQHDFAAKDIIFNGSLAGATVTSIFFGDRVVWSNPDGVDVSAFSSTGFLRNLLKGQKLRAGLDITVNGQLTGAGDFKEALVGWKPINKTC